MTIRRQVLTAIGALALAAPLGARSQQRGKVWRVGYLFAGRRRTDSADGRSAAFLKGMSELGYVEGKNLIIEWRYADANLERLPGLAAELAQLKVDVIVTGSTPAVSAAQKATTTIPIVMTTSGDPVGSGLIKSLARPGGNITGLTNVAVDISAKLVELLLGMVPKLARAGILVNTNNPSQAVVLKNVQTAARRVNVAILPVDVRTLPDIDNAIRQMIREGAGALIVPGDTLLNTHRREIAELAIKNRLPSIAGYWEYADAGGLMSYGQNLDTNAQRAAAFVDKIFKGARAGDLPVEQPTTLELIINRKTAKALGIMIPQSILVSANRMIE